MINQNKLLQALNLREDDSKRLDAIFDSMINLKMELDFKNFTIYYDTEFKMFTVVYFDPLSEIKQEEQIFKDGREAIDYCLQPIPEVEEEPEVLEPKLENKENT